jgi:hypothetical protein
MSGRRNNKCLLYGLLMLELWYRNEEERMWEAPSQLSVRT